jgi:type II secretory pathway component GspD/PulD (secretin)
VDPRQAFFQSRFGGGGGGAGGGGAGGSRGGDGGRVSTPKVVASADELSNSLIVSAPEEQMTIVEDLVKQVDVPVEDIAEIRVFKLKYANAQDTADMLKNLFPDLSSPSSGGNNNNRGGFRGGFFGAFGGGATAGAATGAAGQSQRALKQNRVVAVADARTSSVLVTASATMMEQIAKMMDQLDSDPSKQQKVFVIPVENADPAQMQQILQGLFPSQNTRSTQSSTANGRSGFGTGTTTRNNGGNNTSRTGSSSGFGGTGSSGLGGRSGFGTGN